MGGMYDSPLVEALVEKGHYFNIMAFMLDSAVQKLSSCWISDGVSEISQLVRVAEISVRVYSCLKLAPEG